ncbi:hypothetical protein GTR02_12935, partial [Kineococcus sp. R8]|uniref:hypothetical protein n=1 Tax=Kineococcus siccus TaxID=2696567 RepID=UPI00196B43D6
MSPAREVDDALLRRELAEQFAQFNDGLQRIGERLVSIEGLLREREGGEPRPAVAAPPVAAPPVPAPPVPAPDLAGAPPPLAPARAPTGRR